MGMRGQELLHFGGEKEWQGGSQGEEEGTGLAFGGRKGKKGEMAWQGAEKTEWLVTLGLKSRCEKLLR